MTYFPVVERTHNLQFKSCMGFGPNYYRTFDGLAYFFPGTCSYTLFSDGSRTVTEEKINCNTYSSCRKVRNHSLPRSVQSLLLKTSTVILTAGR